jgi:hypothetical protein
MLCQVVTYNVWSSVVLLECDVVGLGLGERKNKALKNFIPIAYSGQISSEGLRLRQLQNQLVK